MTSQHKISAMFDKVRKRRFSQHAFGEDIETAASTWNSPHYDVGTAKWTGTMSNRMLAEFGFSLHFGDWDPSYYQYSPLGSIYQERPGDVGLCPETPCYWDVGSPEGPAADAGVAGRRPLVQRGPQERHLPGPDLRRQGRRRDQQLHAPLGVPERRVVRHRVAQLQVRDELHQGAQPLHAVEQRQPPAVLRRGPEPAGARPRLRHLRPLRRAGEHHRRAAVRDHRAPRPRERLRPTPRTRRSC